MLRNSLCRPNRRPDFCADYFNSRAAYALSFGKRFRAELRRAPNVEVLLHANVVELLTDHNGRVVRRARISSA